MQVQTLEELKAENAESTLEETTEETVTEVEETEVEAIEETEEEVEQVAEPEQLESEEEPIEAWMQEEEQASEEAPKAKFTGSDIKAARLKERAKAEKKSNKEIEALRAEIEALKSGSVSQPKKEEIKPRPKMEDFNYDQDAYDTALDEWYDSRMEAKVSATQQAQLSKASQEQAIQKLNQSVESHYERATELIQKHGISADVYKQSDIDFRDAIEEVMPDKADLIADGFIATLGEGSEKAIYRLARNKAELKQFQNKLASDPSGFQAMAYLGELKGKLAMPVQRKSSAPKPATKLNGGSGGSTTSEASLQKAYEKAHKSGDSQAAFEARRAAKKAGFNVNNW